MGLDMNPMGKPKPDHEDEFLDLFLKLNGRAPSEGRGLFGKLLGKKDDHEAMTARFQDIMIAPWEAIGAPVVGTDPEADDWVRKVFREGRMPSMASEDEALEKMTGYRALQVMEVCDGFPIYTHAYDYDGVDRTSFRGAFLTLCEGVLSEDIINAAWTNMLADELADWGRTVGAEAASFAEANRVYHVIGQRDAEFDEDSPASKAHIADSAARWAAFWSSRGHGSEAFF